ncbi:hypothetical protein PUN28_005830 [Cardiocondyla obscurior]|uniref:Ribosomal protein S18 n=1 Tax=Cardiocondyla obscurior TaxID=286306 RepID=A0AAW2GBX4_9HYME
MNANWQAVPYVRRSRLTLSLPFTFHRRRARALVEASRCLTRKIAEGPPSKKANKKRPLRARRTPPQCNVCDIYTHRGQPLIRAFQLGKNFADSSRLSQTRIYTRKILCRALLIIIKRNKYL